MSADRWERIQALYHGALERPRAQREKFLSKACRGDSELRREVESLLAHESDADSLLDSPVWEEAGDREVPSLARPAIPLGATFGMFRIVGLLGSGGMGEVYRATDTSLERDVALKILPPEMAGDPAWRSRFKLEARAAAALSHPNICTVYGVEEHGGRPFIVMEVVEGETLAAHLERGPLLLGQALSLAVQIAGALSEAHGKGVVHRDLKPANIMIGKSGAKVLDFGLAKIGRGIAPEWSTHPSTAPGMILGTVQYMSPEQAQGKEADARSDLFSFGVVLYEMVTGERAFSGNSALAVCDAILHSAPRDFGDRKVPAKLKIIVRKAARQGSGESLPAADAVYQELKALEISLGHARSAGLSRNTWIAVGDGACSGRRCRWLAMAPVVARAVGARDGDARDRTADRCRGVRQGGVADTEGAARTSEGRQRSRNSGPARPGKSRSPACPPAPTFRSGPTGEIRTPGSLLGRLLSARSASPSTSTSGGSSSPDSPLPSSSASPLLCQHRLVFRSQFMTLRSIYGVEAPSRKQRSTRDGGGPRRNDGPRVPFEQAPPARVDDFLIDRHEVTNEEYKKFVDAGGYQKREFWKQPFVGDGRAFPWEDAVALFRDATGRPGPATWEVGDYPKGHEKYPVAGVSWYEAAAYAEFVGKSLPTAYHWTRASQARAYTAVIASGSNFRREGPNRSAARVRSAVSAPRTWPATSRSGAGTRPGMPKE